jgi:hypothetical protein
MKKMILLFATVFGVISANAQKGAFIVESGLTFPNYTETVLTNLDFTINSSTTAKQLNVGYYFSNKISVSTGINVSSARTDAKDVNDYLGNYLYSYSFDVSQVAFLLHANYNYLANDKWNLSSGIGVGTAIATVQVTVTPSSFTSPENIGVGGLAIHLTALDAKYYFNNWIGLHGKLGIGSEGLLGLGATFRFNR